MTDYQTAIYNLAWRLVRDREDARDIAQEVFLKAYRQIPKIEGELHLWAWLYRVTVNACWDHLRAGSRRPVSARRSARSRLTEGRDDGEDQAELARLFTASLAQLPPKQQVALLLKDVHGLQHSDIAATLGISRGSSEVLLFRARRSFRNAFTSMTADVGHEPACRFAEQAAAYSVGGRLTEARRRRVLEHARTCPDCRKTVERWSGTHAVGLGLALPLVAAPQLFGAHAAASATANLAASAGASTVASAGASAGASTVASAGASAAASTALTAGASSVVGGLTAKLAGLGVAKAAVVALAATTVVTYGGATAYKDFAKDGGRHAPRQSPSPLRRRIAPRRRRLPACRNGPGAAALAAAFRRPPWATACAAPAGVRRFLALAALRHAVCPVGLSISASRLAGPSWPPDDCRRSGSGSRRGGQVHARPAHVCREAARRVCAPVPAPAQGHARWRLASPPPGLGAASRAGRRAPAARGQAVAAGGRSPAAPGASRAGPVGSASASGAGGRPRQRPQRPPQRLAARAPIRWVRGQ